MNYKLIHKEKELQKFIDFLPELEPNESYFLILIARKKWNPEANIPSAVKLKREAVKKDRIIQTIRQWEVEVGTYQSDGVFIDNENLGVYIGYNPKDQYKACFELINKSLENIKTEKQGINIKSMANDVIQTSNGTKHFIDIDVDIKEGEDYLEIIKFIKSIIPEAHLTIIKTSGGFHCLIKLTMTPNVHGRFEDGRWYMKIKEHPFKSDLNIMSNDLMPLVGCNQGKNIPFILEK
jgi:hypothetical protein